MILVLGKSALSVPDTRFSRVSGSTLMPTISSWYLSTSHTSSGSFPTSEVMFHIPKASFRVQRSGRRGPRLRLQPNPLCNGPLRSLLHVVSPRERGPTSFFRAEPGRAPRSHASPNPGPGSRKGPGCTMPCDVSVLVILFS